MNEKIYLNQEGKSQFDEVLQDLRQSLEINAKEGSESFRDVIGDGWHDNFDFEQSMGREREIQNKIQKMLADKSNILEVKPHNLGKDYVNINDFLEIKLTYENGFSETINVKLTGLYLPPVDEDYQHITLNSPLGKSLFKKRIPSTFEYNVNSNLISGIIVKKKIPNLSRIISVSKTDYEIINFTNIENAIESLSFDEKKLFDLNSRKFAKHYLNKGKIFMLMFSEIHNVFTYIDEESLIVNEVVEDYISINEKNLKQLSILFKADYPEIYKEMNEFSLLGLENYLTNEKNSNFFIIRETIFNMISPRKIILIFPKNN